MTVRILWRSAEARQPSDPWTLVADADGVEAAEDELASWQGPILSHGDLVRLVSPSSERLFVFDGDKSRFVWSQISVDAWEGKAARTRDLLLSCAMVDRRRLAMAACELARSMLRRVPAGEELRPLRAIEMTEAWCRQEATLDQVQDARGTVARLAVEAGKVGGYSASRAVEAFDSVYSAASVPVSSDPVSSAVRAALDAASTRTEKSHLVRKWIPLSVVVCASLGLRDPLPFNAARENPRRRR